MNGMLDGLEALFKTITIAFLIAAPLAVWKLIDIAIWLWTNIDIKWGDQ